MGHYVDIIRPQLDPLGEREELLILLGPEPIKQMNTLMQRLGMIYNIKVQTATEFRRKVATVAADQCSSIEVRLLSKQMSHIVETHRRSYELLHGSKHAAQAHKTIQKLVRGGDNSEEVKKRRKFTVDETETIEKWFNDSITVTAIL